MRFNKLIVIMLVIILINVIIYTINEYSINSWIVFSESEAIAKGHEFGAHGFDHVDTQNYNYNDALDWAKKSKALIEDNTRSTSRWGNTCLSFAYPYSSTNEKVIKAVYDAGFRIAGNDQNGDQFVPNSTIIPQKDEDWMNIGRLGGKVTKGESNIGNLIRAEEEGALADCMFHQDDKLDKDFLDHIDSSTTVWHTTWGEIRSYYYFFNHTIVQYNPKLSNETMLIFTLENMAIFNQIWEVPLTLKFNLSGIDFYNISYIDYQKNSYYQNLENIYYSQFMREGYKYDNNTGILYISMIPGNKHIRINGNFSELKSNNTFMGFARYWNGLRWAVTIHVDDIRDVSVVLDKYEDYKQPLTFMIKGGKIKMEIMISITIISILIMITITLKTYKNYKDRG